MSNQAHRSQQFNHFAAVTQARKLIEQSKMLLKENPASTFLGVKHYDAFPPDGQTKPSGKEALLKTIDENQSQRARADANEPIHVHQTHWREWRDGCSAFFSAVLSPEQGSKL